MGFRGVLLRIAEGDEESGAFRVVAPDAEMALPTEQQRPPRSKHENALTATADQVLVVTDHVSSRLLQVTGCAAVLLQRETHSALWVAALASQKAATLLVEDAQQQGGSRKAVPLQQLSLNAWGQSSGLQNGLGGAAVGGRSCYCFQFRSSVEYDMFERTLQAYLRVQRMSLLENSVLMEIEIEKELAQKHASKAASSSSNDANSSKRSSKNGKAGAGAGAGGAKEQLRTLSREELRAKQQTSRTQGSASAMSRSIQKNRTMNGGYASEPKAGAAARAKARPAADSMTPSHANDPNVRCILCSNTQAQTKKTFTKHPFVLQDARGDECFVCQVCMQQILMRRVQNKAFPKPGEIPTETLCALCSEPESTFTHALKKCVHPACPRLYCTACLHKLVGKAKTHKVWRTRNWYCPCCTNYDTTHSAEGEPSEQDTNTEAAPVAAGEAAYANDQMAKKKRKRRAEVTDENDSKQQQPSASVNEEVPSDMGPVDYAANYFEFLMKRELAKTVQDESEDVCFCCKDGGELVECDWPGDEYDYDRCPKVYHEGDDLFEYEELSIIYCLGYKVPENFVWKCPRHRCQACGIIAMFSCRFCVTSYCKDHVPEEIKKLGPATRDIPDSTYVICKTCEHNAQRALGEGKLSTKTHAILHRLPAKAQKRTGSK